MTNRNGPFHTRLLCGAATIAIAMSGAAYAADAKFDIAPQPLDSALREFGMQSGVTILADADLTLAKRSAGVTATTDPDNALRQLLAGTGLSYKRDGDVFVIAQQGEGGSSPQDSGAGDVDALIVTAQKREEAIQDVPIAISAFTQRSLEEQKIEGGYDLMKAIPNVTFSKSNFTSYNFSIRGVGTKAISATTDPGVAVAFNNTTLIQNRLFEQEYFDVERVEVLRGPQGTLYGRNATSGVINVITAKPDLGEFEGSLKLEAGNYNTQRVVGMLNVPLIEDLLAVRLAGAMTKRDGFDFNELTDNPVNGRDLWSGRVTIGFEPIPQVRANLLWERFEEDDNRSRTGKQLCHYDPGPSEVGGVSTVLNPNNPRDVLLGAAQYGQGCKPGSLYDDAAFGTVNGLSLPFIYATLFLGLDCGPGCTAFGTVGRIGGLNQSVLKPADPYGGLPQSRDLRTIASVRDPVYRAKADVVELSFDFDLTDSLTLTSQTAYNKDEVYSFQDYNRFNSAPAFTDTSLVTPNLPDVDFRNLAPGGFFCDPQIGCTDRIAGFDISQGSGEQFSQEIRLQSSFDGPINFSVGANYTSFETLIDYYVFYNILTATALTWPFWKPENGVIDLTTCPYSGYFVTSFSDGNGPVPAGDPSANCPYIDPNPIESINGDGHNYFRSKNPYELQSQSLFGELYWNTTEALKVTLGLRYTDDTKTFTPVPSQALLAGGILGGGTVSRGYPQEEPIVLQWGEWTGRFGLDWKPEFGLTDETLLYAFYSRGYKGGGANPPTPGFATREEIIQFLIRSGATVDIINEWNDPDREPVLSLTAVDYGRTFEPEFVNAFEVGAKNTLLGGAMTLNVTGFYYDYKDYQVSQIKDRTAVNENFDAKIWGLEFETVFSPTRNFRMNANLGYLDTRIVDGETSIDIMNRTQGDSDYVVSKPWLQLPSNCVIPAAVAAAAETANVPSYVACGGWIGVFGDLSILLTDPATDQPFTFDTYPELNGGAGIRAQLGGNDLPNAPHWTSNFGAQYAMDAPGGWRATVRGDAYWQSQSFARVYNAVNDKLRAWTNVNLSVWLEQPEWGLKVELYAKNVFDETPITDAFLNSDDSGLTTNVFVLDPRLIGFNVRKTF